MHLIFAQLISIGHLDDDDDFRGGNWKLIRCLLVWLEGRSVLVCTRHKFQSPKTIISILKNEEA